MSALLRPRPSHLSLFLTDSATGQPIQRMPLYAEVAVPRVVPMPPPEQRFLEPIRSALFQVDPDATGPARDRIEKAAQQAFSEVVEQSTRDQFLQGSIESVRDLFRRVFKHVLHATGKEHLTDVDPSKLKSEIAAGLRAAAEEFELTLVVEPEGTGILWAEPLGILASDHVGYLSFDLRRLTPDVYQMLVGAIQLRQSDPAAVLPVSIWVYPYGKSERFDVLTQGRFAENAVVARLAVRSLPLPRALQNMGLRSLQNPGLTDWRVSPSSFAASPRSLVGADGCEELVPAQISLQEYVLRHVVHVTNPPQELVVPAPYQAAYVDDYKVSWYALGHSLGEILYSLPLAPGESVKLAVVDWSWDSLSKRDEKTRLTEDLLHQTHRDRTITETVKAGLKEFQHGSSFMGGVATSAGGSGSIGSGGMGLGAAIGNAWSLGGSTATSEGSRELTAENVQRLSDSFSQASSSQRELSSTIVIQARQEEKESIQTRTFTNYNHSHTLTILYYEVLRHYRVTVEWVRRRPAVLVKLASKLPGVITPNFLLSRRYILEPHLLDPKLSAAFDGAGRFVLGEEKLKRETIKWGANVQTNDPGLKSFVKLIAQFTTTDDDTTEPVFVALHLHDGRVFEFQCDGAGDEGTSPEFEKPLPVAVSWNQIKGVEVKLKDINSGGDWEETNILITMVTAANERVSVLADSATRTLDDAGGSTGLLLSIQPPPATTTTIGPKPLRNDFISAEDDIAVQNLISHFEANRTYYNTLLILATDPDTIAIEFESKPWNAGQVMSDYVEPAPLDVFGSYVAFPLARSSSQIDDSFVVDIANALYGNDPARVQWANDQLARLTNAQRQQVEERLVLARAKSERLQTLPTRGVFAEGKLGHCNISEVIDNTRFWDWQSSPIPFAAPDIAPVQAVTPQPQQQNVQPTPFPTSLVNIVNPTAAPDPTGLTASLNLLATPNIFREMSKSAEVADLLKRLSDNTISIAEAANRARAIRSDSGGAATPNLRGGMSPDSTVGTPGTGGPRANPAQPSATNRDLHDLQNLLGQAERSGLTTKDDAQKIFSNAAYSAYTPTGVGGGIPFYIDPDIFDFKPDPQAPDWQKTSCVTIRFGYGSPFLPRMWFDVGVIVGAPITLRDGKKLSVREAQLDSANAATAAATIIKQMLDAQLIIASEVQPRFVGFMGGAIMSTGMGYRVNGCRPTKIGGGVPGQVDV